MSKNWKIGLGVLVVIVVVAVAYLVQGGGLQGKLSLKQKAQPAYEVGCINPVTTPTILFSYDGDDAQFFDIRSRVKNGDLKCNYKIDIVGAGSLVCKGQDLVASSDGKYVQCVRHVEDIDIKASLMGNGVIPAGMIQTFYNNLAITEGFADRVDIYEVPANFAFSAGN